MIYKPKGVSKKAKIVWSLNSKLTQSIRRVWRQSSLRATAMAQALVDCKAKVRDRLYTCAVCGVEYREFDVEVDHKREAPKNSTWDIWISQQFCCIESINSVGICKLSDKSEVALADVARTHLQVLCRKCHSLKTKEACCAKTPV